MNNSDFLEIRSTIKEALDDVSALYASGEAEKPQPPTNMEWRKRVSSAFDKLYNEDTDKEYTPYPVVGYFISPRPEGTITPIGMNMTDGSKILISPEYFTQSGITPEVGDEVLYKGVVYTVVKDREDTYVKWAINFGNQPVLWAFRVKESPIYSQSDELIEEHSPYEDVIADASAPVSPADPAPLVRSLVTKEGPFTFAVDSSWSLSIDTFSYQGVILAGVYTLEEFTAEFRSQLSAYDAPVRLFIENNRMRVSSSDEGIKVTVAVEASPNSINDIVGWKLATYQGSSALVEVL